MKYFIIYLGLLLLLFSGGSAAANDNPGAVERFGAAFSGFSAELRPFPDGVALFDHEDRPVTLEFGEGQPWRLINFWALWCPPCIIELPSLKALQDQARERDDFEVVLVSVDLVDDAATLEAGIRRMRLPEFEYLYITDMYMWQRFDMRGLPVTYMVSPRGLITYTFTGDADWESDKAQAFFSEVLDR